MKRFIWCSVILTFVITTASITVRHSFAQTGDDNLQQSAKEIPTIERQESARVEMKENFLIEELKDLWNRMTFQEREESEENDGDLSPKLRGVISKDEYFRLRGDYISLLRGIDPENPLSLNPNIREKALEKAEEREKQLSLENNFQSPETTPVWTNIGPAPLSNGQTQQAPAIAAVSGRTTTVVVDPTNSNKVYIGTAQGGVWRSLDGGITWSSIFDNAQTLAVGALALAPSNPSILYVGTGEGDNSADSFFGSGVYRIDNADTSATLVGPINPSITTGTTTAITYNCFTGRSITKILVDPTNAATIFVSTATGVGGIGGNALTNIVGPLAARGVFRSTNATAAAGSVTFQKLIVNTDSSLDVPGTGNTSIYDMVLEPGTPNNLLVSTNGVSLGGQIYRSTNALAATPTFTSTLNPGFNGLVMKLAIAKVGSVVTSYVDSNEPSGNSTCSGASNSGRVRKSTDGGVTWSSPLAAAEGYCGGQCSYDNPIAVNPNDANNVYIGGNARGTCSDVLKRSADGGATFTRDDTGLHADSHYIFFDAQTPISTVWFANDGGIWKRPDAVAGTAWLNQNHAPLSTMQFQSVAVHPTDRNFTIGGTQDNGTEAQQATPGNWLSAEGGDGGFALIDQSATNTTNVTMYHTFFNQTNNLIGFDRTNLGTCLATKDSWESRGYNFGVDSSLSCDGTAFAATNGIIGTDAVNFYAPIALGPGTPNTFYFGTQRLYRSTNKGDTMTVISQNPIASISGTGVPISAIGISPQTDNTRIVGLKNGSVFATTTGANTLVDTAFPVPTNANGSTTNRFVSRAVIDPSNSNTAYVTLSYYTSPATAGQIWKTTNLNAATPTWTSVSGSGAGALPNIPVNGFVIDRNDPTHPGVAVLYAGTDIGVFMSSDGGSNWSSFGSGLPRVAVFDMAIQPTSRVLRIATHGRGMYETQLSPTYEGDVQSRPSGDGFVDSDDIQQIRRFSVGLDLPYQSNEFQRADCSPRTTSGDGFVDSDDVQQARRYSVGLDSKQSSGGQTGSLLFEDWQETFKAKSTRSRTDSANTTAQSITNNTATESITQSTESTAQRNSPEAGRAVRIVNQSTSPGQTITVPINVDTTGDETGYTFSIAFDQTKLSATAVTIGSLGGNVTSNINNTTGTIGFSITSFSGTNGVISAATDQSLVTITFTVAGNASQGMTNITFTDNPARRKVSGIDPNTALPQPTFTDGTVSISGPTAATVTVGGRVKTPAGRGISGVRVSLTDSNGQIRTAITTSFGYYQFENVQTGETYILSAKAKHFTFNQPTQLLNATDDTNNIDFIATPIP